MNGEFASENTRTVVLLGAMSRSSFPAGQQQVAAVSVGTRHSSSEVHLGRVVVVRSLPCSQAPCRPGRAFWCVWALKLSNSMPSAPKLVLPYLTIKALTSFTTPLQRGQKSDTEFVCGDALRTTWSTMQMAFVILTYMPIATWFMCRKRDWLWCCLDSWHSPVMVQW